MIGRIKKFLDRPEEPTCKLCSAPLEKGESTCPSCGYIADSESHVFSLPDDDRGVTPSTAKVSRKTGGSETPTLNLRPPGLRQILAGQPEMLEPGLRVETDESGEPIGAGFSTSVGDIDLLARDGSGGFVVVRVGERGQGERLIAETLEQVGWVRKHLGKGKQRVRGMVLMEQVPKDLGYVSAAVADTILVKTYRVAVAFEDLDI